MLVLRSIKELEFDRAMGKVARRGLRGDVGRLRARAVRLMQQLEPAAATASRSSGSSRSGW